MSERPEDEPRERADEEGEQPAAVPAEVERPRTPVTQQIGRIVVLLLLVVFIVFAISNSQPVDFSWVFGETEAVEDAAGEVSGGVPLIVLLLSAFVIGALTGAMLVRISRRRRAGATTDERDE